MTLTICWCVGVTGFGGMYGWYGSVGIFVTGLRVGAVRMGLVTGLRTDQMADEMVESIGGSVGGVTGGTTGLPTEITLRDRASGFCWIVDAVAYAPEP